MHTVATKDLQPGMVTATPVMSRHGQMIVEAHKMLTTQMIAHLEFYGIESARIIDGALPVDAIQSMAEEKEAVDRYSERVRNSKEFKVFKANYEKKVPFLEKSINDFVTKNIPFDQEALLSCALDLFATFHYNFHVRYAAQYAQNYRFHLCPQSECFFNQPNDWYVAEL